MRINNITVAISDMESITRRTKHGSEERAMGKWHRTLMTNHPTKLSKRKPQVVIETSILIAFKALIPTCSFPELLEKFLIKYESHSTDLFYFGFCCCISVDKICCNGNGQFASKFFPTKSWKERNFQMWQQLTREEGRSLQTGRRYWWWHFRI